MEKLTSRDSKYLRVLRDSPEPLTPSRLAKIFGVKLPTVLSELKRLEKLNLIEYSRASGVRLTPLGEEVSDELIWRHRVMETFFCSELGLDLEVACEAASKVEVLLPLCVFASMCEKLGHPSSCPHGRPIPHRGRWCP